jgi:hypothetical protein
MPAYLDAADRALLGAILDTLLPAHEGVPAAGELGIGEAMEALLADGTRRGRIVAILRATEIALGGDALTDRDTANREALLRAVESGEPVAFAILVECAYRTYYSDPRVLARLERTHGYPARPPQPLGHAIEPWDDALVAKQRERGPIWRPVD